MRLEQIDRRVLGAVRFLDGNTGLHISSPLSVEGKGVHLVRNRSSYYVIFHALRLKAHTRAFRQPPRTPALGSVEIELKVIDPGRRYLSRRCTLRLPRDPDPSHMDRENSLFRPVEVRLFPSPTAGTAPGWAVIRATVTAEGRRKTLAGALIRVLRASESRQLASGLSDERGEALVAVPGIPITTWEEGPGPVLTTRVEAILEVVFDPKAEEIPDPDDLEARRSLLPHSRSREILTSGRVLVKALSVPLP